MCEFVWPPNASLYASSTCGYLRLLVTPFDQGFRNIAVDSVKPKFPQNSLISSYDLSRAIVFSYDLSVAVAV